MLKKPFHDRHYVKDMLFSSDLPASDLDRCVPLCQPVEGQLRGSSKWHAPRTQQSNAGADPAIASGAPIKRRFPELISQLLE